MAYKIISGYLWIDNANDIIPAGEFSQLLLKHDKIYIAKHLLKYYDLSKYKGLLHSSDDYSYSYLRQFRLRCNSSLRSENVSSGG